MTKTKAKKSAENAIITVGFCPCWDITCRVDGIEWGEHKKIASQTSVPAGKALNICKAMNWQGIESIAAGLWGRADYSQMCGILEADYPLVTPRLTVASGKTRQNVTLIDTQSHREIHLRAECRLADKESLRQLEKDLDQLVTPDRTLVFAGSMPADYLKGCLAIIKHHRDKGAKVVVDTSGQALADVVKMGKLYLIKPNIDELSELLGRFVRNDVGAIIKAARSLCDKVSIILVSRGKDGVVAVTRDQAIVCHVKQAINAVNTVGCGDFLLAGFLSGMRDGDIRNAVATGVQVATARACGLSETADWSAAARKIKVETTDYPS